LGAFLTPRSVIRDGRKSASGSGIRDERPGSYFLELRNHFFAFFGVKILKFFEDTGSGMETVRILDPGWKKVGSGINIPDPPHWLTVNLELACTILETVSVDSGSELVFKMFLNFDDLGRKSIRSFSEHCACYFLKKNSKVISFFKHESRYGSESVRKLTDLVLGTKVMHLDSGQIQDTAKTLFRRSIKDKKRQF
jgi:hypothetical protein